jgi:two-component system, NarL family, response regulator NreC
MVRILVVDDFEIVRRNLCRLLASERDFEVVSQAATGLEAIKEAERYQPDVVLLDISMPELNGLAATPLIKKVAPNSKILIVSNHDNAGFVREALSSGALGFISKSDLGAEIASAVRTVNNNEIFLGKSLAKPKDPAPADGAV